MDACTHSIVRRMRSFHLCAGPPAMVLCLLAASTVTILGCGVTGDGGTLGSNIDDGGDTGLVDLTGGTIADCDVSYYHDTLSYGLELHAAAVEAVGWRADPEATFGAGWTLTLSGETVLISTEVFPAPYPADLALIVEAANERITLAGGSIEAVIDLILANGEAAIQSNYVLDGTVAYRVDVAKNDYRYSLQGSVAEADLTQTVDNTLAATVTSLCVD